MHSSSASARMAPSILIVDDHADNLRALSECLASPDYRILTAQSGPEALARLNNDDPSLVLLDVAMPGMDGFETCQRIKEGAGRRMLPVILVSGVADPESRRRGLQAGADDFLSRPFDRMELMWRVRSLLQTRAHYEELQDNYERMRTTLEERTQQLERATYALQRAVEGQPERPSAPPPGWEPVREDTLAPAPEPVLDDVRNISGEALRQLKRTLLARLSDTLEGQMDLSRTPEMVDLIGERLAALADASGIRLAGEARQQVFGEIIDEVVGYGPLEPLLSDPTVSEVMVNGPQLVYVERGGQLVETNVQFEDDDHLLRIIDRIIRPLGRRVDRKSPMVDARLPDGSRVNAIIMPCAIDGPSITIRKFSKDKLTVENLVDFGSLTPQCAELLKACVRGRLNIVVAGGTGSGKTTLLNVLSSFIPDGERIVTIEDSAELQLRQKHTVRLETKTADLDGTGEVSIRALVRNALRMRPDRIVVGEVRGGEALDMLQAMNTGHDGSLTTVHANSPRDTFSRLETLVLMAGMDLPLKVVRAQISSAINLVVQQARLRDGSRKVISVSEVQGMEGDVIVLSDIFQFKDQGMRDNRVLGSIEPTGIRPKFSGRLEAIGIKLPPELFASAPASPAFHAQEPQRSRWR